MKNRFGSTNEIGVFEMREEGLAEVPNPSEFMLEGRRFHDIRRWKIAEECMRPTPKAWNIEGDTAEKFYKLGSMKENDTRIFSSPKHYWLAIPNSQLNINGKLVQNPGY